MDTEEVLQMRRRFLSILLTLAIAVSMFAAVAPVAIADTVFGPYTTGNITWRVDIKTGEPAGTLTIERRSGVSGNVSIGDYINTTSGRAPWNGHSAQVDRIVIGANVTVIGNWAFADFSRVEYVEIRGDMTRIGNDAFRGCDNLINIVNSSSAVQGFSSLTTIGANAFDGCGSLRNINMPAVTSLGANAFLGCRSLEHITANANGKYMIVGGVLYEMNTATPRQPIRAIKAQTDNSMGSSSPSSLFEIPQTVTIIDTEAFAYTNVVLYVIPENVTTIRDRAFAYNNNLITAEFLGSAPTTFGVNVFLGANAEFRIAFYPHTLRWTTPTWQGYRSEVNNSRLTLDRYVIVMEKGSKAEIRATVYPGTAAQAVTWKSDDTAVATVAGSGNIDTSVVGVVTGVDPGAATVTATALDSGAVATCYIIVLDRGVVASGVLFDKDRLSFTVGDKSKPLTAIVYPFPDDMLAQDQIARGLVWSSSNDKVAFVAIPETATMTSLKREIVPVQAGTATITVRTADGRSSASCVVTVTAADAYIPVTNIAVSTTTIAMGATINLNGAVQPTNATHHNRQDISWRVVEYTLTPTPTSAPSFSSAPGGVLTTPLGSTGTIIVEATVAKGIADTDWGFSEDKPYMKQFTISVVGFIPVTGIQDVPTLAFAGVPLILNGTVIPANASYKTITWSIPDGAVNTAGAILNANGVLTAQWPGTVGVKATIVNGYMSGTTYEQTFIIKVDPYISNALTLHANPGGSVSGAGAGQFAGGEKITITATPGQGYIFSGWYSSNGGDFADSGRTTTEFTMPGNATTVTAYFTYIGVPVGDVGNGYLGVVLPTPVHYFTAGSIYTKNSGVTFAHVTVRDFQYFSSVSLDGRTLSRNAHYTADRVSGYTQITLANGYLDALNQGAHTLTVHFTDQVTVSAVFTVLWTSQVSQDFDDVKTSDWYYADVVYTSSRGWMTAGPIDARRFRPTDPVTQGEAIDAIWRMAGTPTVLNQFGQPLQGRDASYEWVRANGILPIGGSFNLSSAITRQDVTVLFGKFVSLLRLRYPVVRNAPNFADEWQIEASARSSVVNLYRAGIINGRTASTFVPLGNMTRAEFSAFLHRFATAMENW